MLNMAGDDVVWLASFGFDYRRFPELGNVLLANKELTSALASAAGKYCDFVFGTVLPALGLRILRAQDLGALVRLAKAVEPNVFIVFHCMPDILNALRPWSAEAFQVLADVAEEAGATNSQYIFGEGLPVMNKRGIIGTVENLSEVCALLLQFAANVGVAHLYSAFVTGLRLHLNNFIKSIADLQALVELARVAGPNVDFLFNLGFPVVKDLIQPPENNLQSVGLALIEAFKQKADWNADELKQFVLARLAGGSAEALRRAA